VINLFLIDGASGTGKSDLVEYARASHRRCGVLIKATTRKLRDYEDREGTALDLSFYSREEFKSLHLDYQYDYNEEHYGFSKASLDQSLKQFENVFAIIRSIPLMIKLQADYQAYRVITLYVKSDIKQIEDRMRRQGRNQAEIGFRITRITDTLADYERHRNFFDEEIENSSDKKTYYSRVDDLLRKYSRAKGAN